MAVTTAGTPGPDTLTAAGEAGSFFVRGGDDSLIGSLLDAARTAGGPFRGHGER